MPVYKTLVKSLRVNRRLRNWLKSTELYDLANLEASKLLGTTAASKFESKDIVDFIDGTTNQITVTDDADGTVTLSTLRWSAAHRQQSR